MKIVYIGDNFTNIFAAAFVPVFFRQNIQSKTQNTFVQKMHGQNVGKIDTRSTSSCGWSAYSYFNASYFGEFEGKNFSELFCPNVQRFYDEHDTSFTQCCLETCASTSTATTCSFGDPTSLVQCGGFDISCLTALASSQIIITGVGAVYQCPGVNFTSILQAAFCTIVLSAAFL